jgi:arylsulfatase
LIVLRGEFWFAGAMRLHSSRAVRRAGALAALIVFAVNFALLACGAKCADRPNIVFILADDLGWGDVGCYGQQKIRTPHIDQLAVEGMRFTQAYAGNAVCAPSRCALLTGKHMGHAAIRDNLEHAGGTEGQQPMPRDTVTIAQLLQKVGYRTGIVGKWGLGMPEDHSAPGDFGFDESYGYLCQRQAHTYYPAYLWRNGVKEPLPGNSGERLATTGQTYSHDLIAADALRFIKENRARPFFLYAAFTIPHYALQVPEESLAEYRGKFEEPANPAKTSYAVQREPRAAYAAMITRMDRDIGRMMALLKELGLEQNTLLIFASDNGPTMLQKEAVANFFRSAGPFRGLKGDLYEGGIRIPFIARWTGKIAPGSVNAHAIAFWDVAPTLCELTGADLPPSPDGTSFLPTLLGRAGQKEAPYFYWEYHAAGGSQAVRLGKWKAIRTRIKQRPEAPLELYDLQTDQSEGRNVADMHPDIVAKAAEIMKARTPSSVARWNF